jgi:DNA repair photolyase
MFDNITKTWNPVVGCLHNCVYCWARRLVETKLKDVERYRDGFVPKLVEKELSKRFYKQSVFVSDMGDLFGDWVPEEWITKVIDAIRESPTSNFLFLTKNPRKYLKYVELYPENLVLGATIETNRDYPVSEAPTTAERYKSMVELPYRNKLVSIEPIMDFDLETFVQWIREIKPVLVHVGYDNYNKHLPEPSLSKTKQLMDQLGQFTRVKTLTLRESREG